MTRDLVQRGEGAVGQGPARHRGEQIAHRPRGAPQWIVGGEDVSVGKQARRQRSVLPTSPQPLLGHCHLGLGKLYRRTGKREKAQEHLATATATYREMDMRFWLEKAEASMRD